MKHSVKRVAAIHDLSGFGRASLIKRSFQSFHPWGAGLSIADSDPVNHTGDLILFSFCRFYRLYAGLYRSLERIKY